MVRDLVMHKVAEFGWTLVHRYLYSAAEEAALRAKENQLRDARTEERVTAERKKDSAKREVSDLADKLLKAHKTDDEDK